jgi:hypothetical protein
MRFFSSNKFKLNNIKDNVIKTSDHFAVSLIYAFLDMCIFFNLTQQETIFCMRKFVFNSNIKNAKIDNSIFYELIESDE